MGAARVLPFRRTLGADASASQLNQHVIYSQQNLPDGDKGIARTIAMMRKMAMGDQGRMNPLIRQTALQITQSCQSRDIACEANTVMQWVKQNIKFVGEADETVQTPMVTLKWAAGDCDDHSTLIAALLLSLGHQVTFDTMAVGGDPTFVHVVAMDNQKGQWVTLDSTVAESTMGWRPENINRDRKWGPMNGLGNIQRGFRGPRRSLGAYSPRVQRLIRMRGMRGLGADPAQCDPGYYIDDNGDCQPINAATTLDQVLQTATPLLQPLVNAQAYRNACGVGPFIDPSCGYNPNTNIARVNFNAQNTSAIAGLNISTNTLVYGSIAALLIVVVAKSARGRR